MNDRFRYLIVGLYAWLASTYFGVVLLDRLYTNQLKGVLGDTESAIVYSQVSDTLLCISSLVVISAIGAVAVSWKSGMARNLFIASLLVFSLELVIPIFSFLIKNAQGLSGIELFPSGIASVLAMIGLYKYYRG